MTNRHGTPIWYELIAPDAGAAERFYGNVLGWRTTRPPGGLARDYRVAETRGGEGVAGLMARPEGMTGAARWHVYFAVEDVDASVAKAEAAGARVHVPPTDIPGVGRFAFLADPGGTPFYLLRGASAAASRAFVCGEEVPQGHGVWNELSAADPDAALRFYERVLALRAEGGMPMGALGMYRFLHAGSETIGALMGAVPGGAPGWLVYFSVDDVDAAAARLAESGGRALQGPDPIPGGAFSLVAEDDQGARFGLVGPRAG